MRANAILRIVAFIGRLTAHEAMGIMAWDDPWNIEADKVDGWLMNEEATIWDQVGCTELSTD